MRWSCVLASALVSALFEYVAVALALVGALVMCKTGAIALAITLH